MDTSPTAIYTLSLHDALPIWSFVGLHVLGGVSRNSSACFIVKARAVHADEETGVAIHFYDAFDTALVESDVLPGGQGHEAVWQKRDGVDTRLELPLFPAIVVLRGRELERFQGLGPREDFIAQFARKKPGQNRMVRLANQDKMITVLLNDHGAALVRSDA